MGEIYSPTFLEHMIFKFEAQHVNVTWKRKPLDFALRDPWIEEMEESASHHVTIICFALLRAEIAENDAREARRWPEIIRNLNFWPSKKSTFLMPAYRFSLWLWHLTSFLKRLNTTLPCWNLQPKVSRTYDLRIWSWTCKCYVKVKTSGFCPSGPMNRRNGGECFAPCYRHDL